MNPCMAASDILYPKYLRDHTPRIYTRYRFWHSCISLLGSCAAVVSFEQCTQAFQRCQSPGSSAPRAACRAWWCTLGTLSSGIASLKQDEISMPAVEICLCEDHRIKTKTLKPPKKLFLTSSVGSAALGTMLAITNCSYWKKKKGVSIASVEPSLARILRMPLPSLSAAPIGAPGAQPSCSPTIWQIGERYNTNNPARCWALTWPSQALKRMLHLMMWASGTHWNYFVFAGLELYFAGTAGSSPAPQTGNGSQAHSKTFAGHGCSPSEVQELLDKHKRNTKTKSCNCWLSCKLQGNMI